MTPIPTNQVRSKMRPHSHQKQHPCLKFTPWSWAKLLHLRDAGPTEVGGFGVTDTADPSLITDFRLVKQRCNPVHVAFVDEAVADFFDEQVDQGLLPVQFARIWIHTHPGSSPHPSATDEETFCRVFGNCDWALMFILARRGATYARLRFNSGPGGEVEFTTEVDFTAHFPAADHSAWQLEYELCVSTELEQPIWIDEPYQRQHSRRDRTRLEHPEDLIGEDFFGDTAWI